MAPFRTTGIFSVIVILLVARMEYSQSWTFFWSRDWTDWNNTFPNNRNILSHCHSIGHPHGIFSVMVVLLVERLDRLEWHLSEQQVRCVMLIVSTRSRGREVGESGELDTG
eukprot:458207-Prorocentrum_minimum.AAC.1